MTWRDAHARGKLQVLKEVSQTLCCFQGKFRLSSRELMFQSIEFQTQAFLAAVVVELALRGRPVREAGESLCLCLLSVSPVDRAPHWLRRGYSRLPWVIMDSWIHMLWQLGYMNIISSLINLSHLHLRLFRFDRNDRSAAREEDVNGGVSPRKGYTRWERWTRWNASHWVKHDDQSIKPGTVC